MSGHFIDDRLNSYRPSYRSLAFSPNLLGESSDALAEVEFYFEDGSVMDARDFSPLPEPCLDWAVLNFQKFARHLKRPWMVVHGDYFSSRQWNPRPQHLDPLRREGLNIFMYEPLFIYNEDRTWPWRPQQGSPYFFELENIQQFVKENKITAPVTVFLGEYGLGAWLQDRFPHLLFKDFNSYFQEATEICLKYTWPTLPAESITHKFLSLNFRYEALREMLVGHLQGTGRLSEGFASFYHFHDRKEFLKRLPFDPLKLSQWPGIEQGIGELQNLLPLSLDATNPKKSDPILESIPDVTADTNIKDMWKIKSEFYPKAFVFLYSESRPFSPRGEISEKTIHPLISKKPFLVFAAPYFLRQLRALGFKTFSNFWDESFDELEDPQARFEKYLQTVDSVLAKSLPELQQLHVKMQEVLDHNHQWLTEHAITHQQNRLLEELKI